MAILNPEDLPQQQVPELKLSMEQELRLRAFADEVDQCEDIAKLREVAKKLHMGFECSECGKRWLAHQLLTGIKASEDQRRQVEASKQRSGMIAKVLLLFR